MVTAILAVFCIFRCWGVKVCRLRAGPLGAPDDAIKK